MNKIITTLFLLSVNFLTAQSLEIDSYIYYNEGSDVKYYIGISPKSHLIPDSGEINLKGISYLEVLDELKNVCGIETDLYWNQATDEYSILFFSDKKERLNLYAEIFAILLFDKYDNYFR